MDEALALPSEMAVHTALRTQQILAYESGVANTVDATGGSYAIEQMTNQIEDEARRYILKIDSMGGVLKAVECGYIQREIQDAAYRFQKRVEVCEDVIVGVNRYADSESKPIEILIVNEAVGEEQCRKLAELRAARDNEAVRRALQRLRLAARGRENLMPPILKAVKTLATVGEISDGLRSVFGVYHESVTS
jgi:methylmalonyl-CoA mutase N-terminal domain/subunit